MTVAAERKRTRPARGDRAPTVNITLRLKPSLLDDLRQQAQKNETSIAAEAEARLSQPRIGELARMIEMVVTAVEKRAGKRWSDDDSVKRRCRAATEFTLNVLLGSPIDAKALKSSIVFHQAIIESAITNPRGLFSETLAPDSLEKSKQMLDLLSEWSDGQKEADEALEVLLGSKT